MPLTKEKIRDLLLEDLGFEDITTEMLVPEDLEAEAKIITNEDGILAGVNEAKIVFEDLGVKIINVLKDGTRVKANTSIMELKGSAKAILQGERLALNLLMKMSGIATTTATLIEKAHKFNPKIKIAATRKTTPGFRYFEKKAVRIGGGDPHRYRLDDAVLIKSNHLTLAGGLEKAIALAKERASFTKKIEVEVNNPSDALKAAQLGVDIVMLDNFSTSQIKETIAELKKVGLRNRILLEASGQITPLNIEEFAKTGVDIVSMSYLTLAAEPLDMNLRIIYPQ
ncbi:MAG: carboxylating nicotinate-nucleotide diphosphorylase [Euryarchaeota archaeon]|nr:carboxylating nicotinate-nucleotide diphosphorylase [Euryarchaeota archaeon]